MISHLSSTQVSVLDSPWHLSQAEISQFDKLGFVKLEQRIPKSLLEQLIHGAERLNDLAFEQLEQAKQNPDFVFNKSLFFTFLNRALHFNLYAQLPALDVLGCPQVLAIAESLCGTNFIPTIDMMVFKHQHNHAVIPWHQDLIYPSEQYRIATIGIYLDDAEQDDGALQILPQTQHHKQDICAIIDAKPKNYVQLSAKAGDIIVHNPMCVHSSNTLNHQKLRRTLYYECRPIESLFINKDWNEQLISQRLGLLNLATTQYRTNHPEQSPFKLRHQLPPNLSHLLPSKVTPSAKTLSDCYFTPLPFDSANACHRKSN